MVACATRLKERRPSRSFATGRCSVGPRSKPNEVGAQVSPRSRIHLSVAASDDRRIGVSPSLKDLRGFVRWLLTGRFS